MSAEERPLTDAEIESLRADLNRKPAGYVTGSPLGWIVRLLATIDALRVSVPTEPGAPDPEYDRGWGDGWAEAARLCSHHESGVPTEPGAPDPEWGLIPNGDETYRFAPRPTEPGAPDHEPWFDNGAAVCCEAHASRPVPAPEPSARLREALDAWEQNGAPNRKSLAAFGIRPTLAAAPQGTEA